MTRFWILNYKCNKLYSSNTFSQYPLKHIFLTPSFIIKPYLSCSYTTYYKSLPLVVDLIVYLKCMDIASTKKGNLVGGSHISEGLVLPALVLLQLLLLFNLKTFQCAGREKN